MNIEIKKKLAENNIGFECVSVYEVKYLRDKLFSSLHTDH